jgi:hypothetical protein
MDRIAKCHCGDLQLICRGEPRKVSMCHCFDCQRRTGSAFSVAVFYLRAEVSVTGAAPERFERNSASGHPVEFHFCRRCGSNVFWIASRMPDLIGVALGAFADPNFSAPVQSVWTKDKHHWIKLPDTLTQFEHVSESSPLKT